MQLGISIELSDELLADLTSSQYALDVLAHDVSAVLLCQPAQIFYFGVPAVIVRCI